MIFFVPKFKKRECIYTYKQGGFQNGNINNLRFIYCRRLYDQSSTGGDGKMKKAITGFVTGFITGILLTLTITLSYMNENMIDMNDVTEINATETGVEIILESGNGYYWER